MPGHHPDVTVDGPRHDELGLTGPELPLDGDQMHLNICHERSAFRSICCNRSTSGPGRRIRGT
jgi:hypothetical protein